MNTTDINQFQIRQAGRDDCKLILQFIKDLAKYEKLSHEVVATEEKLDQHLFGDQPKAEVLIGEFDGQPVGFALFFQSFSTFLGQPGIYLEDLFVDPAHRGKGFGKALLTWLASIAVQRNCGRLEWSVLDWNQPAIDFYHSLGADSLKGWTVNRVTGDGLTRLGNMFENRS